MSGGLVITQPCLVAGRFESICRYKCPKGCASKTCAPIVSVPHLHCAPNACALNVVPLWFAPHVTSQKLAAYLLNVSA